MGVEGEMENDEEEGDNTTLDWREITLYTP